MSIADPQQRCIVILGAHRSGTSAMARMVNLLGVGLGQEFVPAGPDNPTGYWEHLIVYNNHERILNGLGRVWHSLTPLPENWWLDEAIKPYQNRLLAVLRREFSKVPIWGVKDPRMCRLLPIWEEIFRELACQPYFIYMFRNPNEACASMEKRDGFSQQKCSLLWLSHILESELSTRDSPRVFVSFEQLLGDWEATAKRISETLGVEWPRSPENCRHEVSDFLQPSLRHTWPEADFTGIDASLRGLLERTYDALLDASRARDISLQEQLSQVRDCLVQIMTPLPAHILLEEAESLRCRLIETDGWVAVGEDQLAERNAQLDACKAHLAEVLGSRSWKITAPLRYFFDLIVTKDS